MCVIIDRGPGVKIPAKMLETACDINKHGYGLSYVFKDKTGKKRLSMFKKVEVGKDNDPKEIADLLETHKNKRVFLHLRHATVGEVNVENLHPFFPSVAPDTGLDIGLMHNGTLFDWKPSTGGLSDSHNFTYAFVKPLIERIIKFTGPEKVLSDPLFQAVMLKYIGMSSTLLLFDNYGNVFRINENNGQQHEGWWSSNKYSFDINHYRSSTKPPYNYCHAIWDHAQGKFVPKSRTDLDEYGAYGGDFSADDTTITNVPWERKGHKVKSEAWSNWERELADKDRAAALKNVLKEPDDKRLRFEFDRVAAILTFTLETKDSIMNITQQDLEIKRKTFVEQAAIKDLFEVGRLTKQQIEDMCQNYPKATAALIIDLLALARKTQ